MSKKGYQKQLPRLLVPPPRAAPDAERMPPGEHPPEGRPETTGPAVVEEQHQPEAPATRSGTRVGMVVAVTAVGLAVAIVVAAVVVVRLMSGSGEESSAAGPTASFVSPPPVPVRPGESYVDLQVLANGEVEATQWIVADEPIGRLQLELPDLAGAEDVTASLVVVLADGKLVAGPSRITGRSATYVLDEATAVKVSYRLSDALVRSSSVSGRALAAAGLVVAYEPRARSESRVVQAPGLSSLACGDAATGQLVPCGTSTAPDEWSVDLTGADVADRLVAQLTLPED